jgi:WD40 repeat protein
LFGRAYRVQYNPKYEELVLSSGTDSRVNLWHVARALSGDAKPRSPFGSPKGPSDSLLRAYTEQEDSVYGLAWSTRDPWVFASVSYDGRVCVPKALLDFFFFTVACTLETWHHKFALHSFACQIAACL